MNAAAVVYPFRRSQTRREAVAGRLRRATGAPDAERWAIASRTAMESLGPVFAAFAAYLGSRIDLLPAAECAQFAKAATTHSPLTADALRRLREQQRAGRQLAAIDGVPVVVSPPTQVHRARLHDGRAVRIEIPMPWFDDFRVDLDLLELAQFAFAGRVTPAAFDAAALDFRAAWAHQEDLPERLSLLAAAAREASDGGALWFPVPFPELSSPHLLVTTDSDVHTAAASATKRETTTSIDSGAAVSAWLRDTLFGTACMVVAPVAFGQGGEAPTIAGCGRISSPAQQSLTAYLFAVAADMPDRAWHALRQHLRQAPGAQPADEVLSAFQRLVPFRDDRRTNTGSVTADTAFLQWRIASEHGWLPTADLVLFYRGLFGIVWGLRDCTGGADVLAEAISTLRMRASVRQLSEWTENADVMLAMEQQMGLMLELPQRVDRLLSTIADGTLRLQLVNGGDSVATRRSRFSAIVAVLLVAAAVLVLAGAAGSVSAVLAVEPWRSIALLASGMAVVWVVGRLR